MLTNGYKILPLNASLTAEIVGSQVGTGSKTVTTSKQIIRCITKKSGVIVETKEIPTSVLESGDVVLLGNASPIAGTTPDSIVTGKSTWSAGLNQLISLGTDASVYLNAYANGAGMTANQQIGLVADLSATTGASITYNGLNSFTITVTDSTLSVYLCA